MIISPLVALKHDIMKRCREKGINACAWPNSSDDFKTYERCSLLVVTPESSVTNSFKRLVDHLKDLHLLDRIFFDECHMYLECSSEFRPVMKNIGQ